MSKNKKIFTKVLSFVVLATVLLSQMLPLSIASAAQITLRSLTLKAGVTDGGSMAGGVVNHEFTFTIPTTADIGSIKFEYCTLAAGVPVATDCTMPNGLDTTSATLGYENNATGFANIDVSTNGTVIISRVAAASIPATTIATYRLDAVTNPTTPNETFFVRMKTYNSLDATGTATDAGVVNASTAAQIFIEGIMPESLVFCTGATVGLNGVSGLPDCATATAGNIIFDKLFSPTDTATTTSQMAASTNAGRGYAITVNGPTLTSGTNTILAMPVGVGQHGVSQFGLNLMANTTTATNPFGIVVAPAANATNYRGQAADNYDQAENFKYGNNEEVANSANGGVGGTDAQIFTVAYIVNVPGSQPAGTYTTTLTYICTPTF